MKDVDTMSGNEKTKVLYIAGWGRSGSTLLDNVLGQTEGFFSAGELRHIWQQSVLQNTLCGCGLKFRDCEVWRKVFSEAFNGFDEINAQRMAELAHTETRSLRIPWLFITKGKGRLSARQREYSGVLEKLYCAIGATTQSNFVIDSSKYPMYASMLMLIPSIDLYVIHVVRDPRAVAYSWTSPKATKEASGRKQIEYRSPLMSSIYWNTWNSATEFLGTMMPNNYVQLRYEDLISEPQLAMKRVFEKVGVNPSYLPDVSNSMVTLKPSHTVWGNPARFQVGPVELRVDDRWKVKLKLTDKLLVTFLTFPRMMAYKYKIW